MAESTTAHPLIRKFVCFYSALNGEGPPVVRHQVDTELEEQIRWKSGIKKKRKEKKKKSRKRCFALSDGYTPKRIGCSTEWGSRMFSWFFFLIKRSSPSTCRAMRFAPASQLPRGTYVQTNYPGIAQPWYIYISDRYIYIVCTGQLDARRMVAAREREEKSESICVLSSK